VNFRTGWARCPSVTPNGKKFFYGLTVVWERIEQKWIIQQPKGLYTVMKLRKYWRISKRGLVTGGPSP
jgi:hypothetical protein